MAESTHRIPRTSFWYWCLRNPVETVAVVMAMVLTVIIFLQVVYRYLLHAPIAWSEEFAMFLFQWCSFLGAAIAVRQEYNFRVDLLVSRMPGRVQAAAHILSSLIIYAVAYVMIHMGIQIVIVSMDHLYSVLRFPIAYGYLVFPVSGALMAIYQFPVLVRQIRKLVGGNS